MALRTVRRFARDGDERDHPGLSGGEEPVEEGLQGCVVAVAAIHGLDGTTRSEAAPIGGVTPQTVRDRVGRLNASGSAGLASGRRSAGWCAGWAIASFRRARGTMRRTHRSWRRSKNVPATLATLATGRSLCGGAIKV
jgi:hypothetical protein